VRECGAELVLAPVAEPGGSPRHDPARLAAALAPVAGVQEPGGPVTAAGDGTGVAGAAPAGVVPADAVPGRSEGER
jgi:hypothetical protein